VLGEKSLDIIGLELGIRFDVVVFDEPISHISLLPGLLNVVRQSVPVVL